MSHSQDKKRILDDFPEQIRNTMRTSFLTAYPKIFTSIPYSINIFEQMLLCAVAYGFDISPSLFVSELAVEIEGRYSALSRAIKNCLLDNRDAVIVELGAGLSPRRFEFEEVEYYEFDYPPISNIKKEIIHKMGKEVNPKYFYGVDLTRRSNFSCAIKEIEEMSKGKRIVFNSEGLFWYLSIEEMNGIVDVIRGTMERYNGIWITGDTPIKNNEITPKYRTRIADSANRHTNKPFDSYAIFKDFFEAKNCKLYTKRIEEIIDVKDLLAYRLFGIEYCDFLNRLRSYSDISIIVL